jgi:hypothetical protein
MTEHESARGNILGLMDDFISTILQIRRVMIGMSISAIVLAPLGIALSAYLILHPSFFAVLEIENEFGLILSILLAAVIIISGIWLATGIKQYRSISHWKTRYDEYAKEKQEIDRKIATQFGLDNE